MSKQDVRARLEGIRNKNNLRSKKWHESQVPPHWSPLMSDVDEALTLADSLLAELENAERRVAELTEAARALLSHIEALRTQFAMLRQEPGGEQRHIIESAVDLRAALERNPR